MIIQYLIAFLAAFLIVLVFGKVFIPWLKKHNAYQPLKNDVKDKVYSEEKK